MFRLLTISTAVVLLTTVLVSADNSVRSVDQSTFQSTQVQPTLLRPIAIDGVPIDQAGQDFSPSQTPAAACDGLWQGPIGGYLPSWFYGDETYAVYQDPNETGCSNTYPFTVDDVHMNINSQGAATFDVQPMIWAYSGPDVIGAVLCSGPVLTYNLPSAGLYEIAPAFTSPCTVNGPYYAGIYFVTFLGTNIIDIVLDDGTTVPPRSDATYNEYGIGWVDLVDDAVMAWNLLLWSTGETATPAGCTDPNCVEVSSMTVTTSQQNVEIPIYLDNQVDDLAVFVVPLKIETISGTASITSARLEYRDRITGSVFDIRICQQNENSDNSCTSYPIVGTVCGSDYPVAAMPESFLFAGVKIFEGLPAGQDVDGSLVLIVDIGPGGGTMLIDTTCMAPANRIEFVTDPAQQSIRPSFQSGIITVSAQPATPTTIQEINYDLNYWTSEYVELTGIFIYDGQNTELWVNSIEPRIKFRRNWSKHIVLDDGGAMPVDPLLNNGDSVRVTGIVSQLQTSIGYMGNPIVGKVSIDYLEVLVPSPSPGPDLLPPDDYFYESGNAEDCDSCAFALIIGGYHPMTKRDVEQKYAVKKDSLNHCPDNVIVLYPDPDNIDVPNGTTDGAGNFTSGGAFPVSEENIARAFAYIKAKMKANNCDEPPKKAKLQVHTTSHGSGYHTAEGQPSIGESAGYAGGRVDANGDEENTINENDLKFNGEWPGDMDVDGDGDADIRVTAASAGPPARPAEVWHDTDGDGIFEEFIGSDTNGDGRIDNDDANWDPPDLNGSGTVDDVAFDDTVNLGGSEELTDDELREYLEDLQNDPETGLEPEETRVEMDQCFSGSFVDDLEDVTQEVTTACAAGEVSYSGRDADGHLYGEYQRAFMTALGQGQTWAQSHAAGQAAVTAAGNKQTPQRSGPPPTIKIERTQESLPNQPENISITIENSDHEMGGFDFLIAYDATALAFMGAEMGQLLEDCGWEYFTYRTGAGGNCPGVPDGLMRIIAIAETNNGAFHPSCYGPPDTDPHELVTMSYLVTNDRTFECQYVPIRFYWCECGDNSISSVDGEVLYVSDHVYDFEGTDITDSTYGFPTYYGAQHECLDGGSEFPMESLFDYYNGGVQISCEGFGCCGEFTSGQTGNTDCDDQGKRNLADITRLIDYVYISKAELCCVENGNTDGDEQNKTNLADITKLIDHVYISKVATAVCE